MSSLFHVLHCNYSLGGRATDAVSWMRKATRIDIRETGPRDARPHLWPQGETTRDGDPPTSPAEMRLRAAVWSGSGGTGSRSAALQQEDGVSVAAVGVQSAYGLRRGMCVIPPN